MSMDKKVYKSLKKAEEIIEKLEEDKLEKPEKKSHEALKRLEETREDLEREKSTLKKLD